MSKTIDMRSATERLEPALRYLSANPDAKLAAVAAKFKVAPTALWAWLGQFNAGKRQLPAHRIDGVKNGQTPAAAGPGGRGKGRPSVFVADVRVRRMEKMRGRERLAEPAPVTIARPFEDLPAWFRAQGLAHQPVVSHIVPVTPEVARGWLSLNQGNRKPSQAKIRRFAAAMRAGRWTLNGESVKFSVTGRLLDGQSRLQAVVQAGTAVELEIRGGLPDAAQESMDVGEVRKGAHMLEMLGEKYPAILAPALKFVWRVEHGALTSAPVGSGRHKIILENADIKPLMGRHIALRASVGWCVSAGHKAMALMPPSELAFWHYLLGTVSPAKRDSFMDQLASGLGLTATSPTYHLRERLQADRLASARISQRERFALVVKAWNAHQAGEPLKQLYFRSTGDAREAFPEIAGVKIGKKRSAEQ